MKSLPHAPYTLRLWLIPAAVTLAIYWRALGAWFQQDDFAWMSLIASVRDGESVWTTLFKPSQHGTWRPLSERAYFLLFPWLFGYESWPMRVVCFATQLGSLAVVGAITLRLTGSRLAAVTAPVLWIANSKMVIAMISNGAYVHVLGGFLLLLATWLLMVERWRLMWIAFLTGFLATEANIVFPAMASAYCLMIRRDHWRRVLWLWPVSAVYWLLHMWLAPKMSSGSYAMHFGAGMLESLYRYWTWVFQPDNLAAFSSFPEPAARYIAAASAALLVIYAIWQACLKQFTPLLFLSWFAVLIGPVLPLQGHVTDYYLTIPLSAFGMLAASALARRELRLVAGLGCAIYLALMIPVSYGATRWWTERSHVAEGLVRRVFAAHQLHPEKTIVLERVSDEQFWAAIAHYPFLRRGKTYVFLDPASRGNIQPHPESGVILDEFFPPRIEGPVLRLDASGR
ncbi:MAG: hypothetical protein JNL98_34760 [Bryobacterales bacterium]|nr:hypothetical protein [Bryobacterales bacterium]